MKRALVFSGGGARGAFQVGVWKFLQERNWHPDLICGTSVGAINAVAIGCGLDSEQMNQLWKTYNRQKLYKFKLNTFMWSMIKGDKFSPLTDTNPMKDALTQHMDIEALKYSRTEILITAVDIQASRLTHFNKHTITIEHLMAAGSVPLVFPWGGIHKKAYWDGGIIDNIPILPALEHGAKEIIVVLLSPVSRAEQPLPASPFKVLEIVVEQILVSSYEAIRGALPLFWKDVRVMTVAPARMLGLQSFLNFSIKQAETLIQEGYEAASEQLSF